ncbi:MAG: glutamate-5-semialdehyde dehydrogenase [Candidatus Gracilibacteria bacterium]|jgi:glutamate-5-semialdehyde dehydrogenase
MPTNLQTQITQKLIKVQKASRKLASLSDSKVNQILKDLAKELKLQTKNILAANQKDLKKMEQASPTSGKESLKNINAQNPQDPKYDRLKLTAERINAIAADLLNVAKLPSPLHKILEKKTLKNGLQLSKISVPLGVIGVIYEARPNVTIDVFSLCLKSGNACILKGGSDAQNSNIALAKIIQKVLEKNNVDQNIIYLLGADGNLNHQAQREALSIILQATSYIDVIIPRGGQSLIKFVRENSKVPVIETGAGIVHTFFDESGKLEYGRNIILNAKTRRPSVCNSLDTLIIHEKRLKDLPKLVEPLLKYNVEIFADKKAHAVLAAKNSSNRHAYNSALLHLATPEDFGREFLSLKMSIKTVRNLDEALEHIQEYSSKHSEAIISENPKNIQRFLNEVDAACVYANAPTSFSDGGQFGMGAEIGISTQKLHARGPMALPELTSYKWLVKGKGQIRT